MIDITEVLSDVSFQDGNWILFIPSCLMAVDIFTGIVHAWQTGHLKSYKMREGLGRKFGEVMVLFIGHLFEVGMNFPVYILSLFSLYIILMEIISICENLKKLGVPIPKFVDSALASMNTKIQNGGKIDNNTEDKDDGDREKQD